MFFRKCRSLPAVEGAGFCQAYSWKSRKRGQNFGGMKCMFRFGFSRSVSSVVRLTLMCSGFLRGVRSVFFNLFRLFLKPSEKILYYKDKGCYL